MRQVRYTVRFLTCVYAAVSCQITEVNKCLITVVTAVRYLICGFGGDGVRLLSQVNATKYILILDTCLLGERSPPPSSRCGACAEASALSVILPVLDVFQTQGVCACGPYGSADWVVSIVARGPTAERQFGVPGHL